MSDLMNWLVGDDGELVPDPEACARLLLRDEVLEPRPFWASLKPGDPCYSNVHKCIAVFEGWEEGRPDFALLTDAATGRRLAEPVYRDFLEDW